LKSELPWEKLLIGTSSLVIRAAGVYTQSPWMRPLHLGRLGRTRPLGCRRQTRLSR